MRNESLLRLLPVKRPADITHFNKLLDFTAHSWPLYAFSSEQKGAYNSTMSIMQTIQHVSTPPLSDHHSFSFNDNAIADAQLITDVKEGQHQMRQLSFSFRQPASITFISSRRWLTLNLRTGAFVTSSFTCRTALSCMSVQNHSTSGEVSLRSGSNVSLSRGKNLLR